MIHERYARAPDVLCREIAGEHILVPCSDAEGSTEHIYHLNEVAATMWTLLDGHRSLRQVVDAITSTYDVTPEDAERDLLLYIAELKSSGLVDLVSP